MELPKYKVMRGKDRNGKPMFVRVDPKLQRTFNDAIKRNKKNWDYVCIVAGIPGAGKSQFARVHARYLCPWFDEKYIAFNHEQFIEITNNAPEYSAVILDESFASLNTKMTMSPEFAAIVNHLQLIRKKRLFIFLCLPNFFDLSKGVAIFRASHLFVVYEFDDGERGRFLVFDRDSKRKLYIKGKQYMDYNAEKANYFGRFYNDEIVPEDIYEELKNKNLKGQSIQIQIPNIRLWFGVAINLLKHLTNETDGTIASWIGCSETTFRDHKNLPGAKGLRKNPRESYYNTGKVGGKS
jgi:hypothetical protein